MASGHKQSQAPVVGGFLLGASLGALAGLLFAPRSGRETREQLQVSLVHLTELAETLSLDLQSQTTRLSDQALEQWQGTLNRLREAILAGIEASQREASRYQDYSDDMITIPVQPRDLDPTDAPHTPDL